MRAVLAVVLAFSMCPGAEAATVSVQLVPEPDPYFGETPGQQVHYEAGGGEANDLTLTYGADGGSVTVQDAGAGITAGSGCDSVDAHTATCEPTRTFSFDTDRLRTSLTLLGDGNDRVRAVDAEDPTGACFCALFAAGGDGADQLLGTGARDFLDGGGGADRVSGGDNDDVLLGGGGTDTVLGEGGGDVIADGDGAAPDRDVLDGGAEGRGLHVDEVVYSDRTTAVTIDLSRRRVVEAAGAGDRIAGFEDATGGKGDDRLVGTRGPNHLSGGAGNDRLAGGAADDELNGGRGSDRFACGAGDDFSVDPEAGELLERRCEDLLFVYGEDDVIMPAYPRRKSDSRVRFGFSCPTFEEDDNRPCNGVVTLLEMTGRKRRLGRARFRERDDDEVTVRLNRLGRRLANRRRGVATDIQAHADDDLLDVAWAIRLRV
jgi:hypothetical protein